MKITRYYDDDKVTLGVMWLNERHHPIYTLELPWKDNQQSKSCIPTGNYLCMHHTGTRFPDSFILDDVPGRSAILIHTGNYTRDTYGCILPGLGVLPDRPMVTRSHDAMNILREYYQDEEDFNLEIEYI